MKHKAAAFLIASATLTAFASAAYSDTVTPSTGATISATNATNSVSVPKHRHYRIHHPKKPMTEHAPHSQLNEGAAPSVTPATATTTPPTTKVGSWFLAHITGNFDLTTNYMFRGISQTSDLPAAQGGLTLTNDLGIYFNLWGSNVSFPDLQGRATSVEFDYILGVTNKIGDNFSYDINMDRYSYPRSGASYNELIGNFVFYFLTAQVGYSSNVFASHGNGTYVNLGFNFPIPERVIYFNGVNFTGGIGHYSLPFRAGHSYYDYNLALSKKLDKYTFEIQWTDTNGAYNFHPYDRSKIIGTVTVSF